MRYRSTIVYLIAALVLGGVLFLDLRSEKKEEAREEEAKTLFHEVPKDLTRLILKREDRTIVVEKTREEKDGKGWVITSPVQADADVYLVNRITNLLPHLKHTRIIQESGEDLASFGLKPPRLTLTWASSGAEGTLSVGEKSPIDKDFYAMTGDRPRIFLLAAHDEEVLNKDLYDLRDKGLFTLTSDRVTRFSVERPSESWSFVKSGETTWSLEGDPAFPVDSERIGAAVRRLSWEEAASFEAETAEDLSAYRLDTPDLRIGLQAGDTIEELLVGKAVDQGAQDREERRYVRMAHRPQIMTIQTGVLEDLPESLEDLRMAVPEEGPKAGEPAAESGQ